MAAIPYRVRASWISGDSPLRPVIRIVSRFPTSASLKGEIPSVLGLTGPVFAALDVEQGKPPVLDYEIMHGDKTREAFQAALNAK